MPRAPLILSLCHGLLALYGVLTLVEVFRSAEMADSFGLNFAGLLWVFSIALLPVCGLIALGLFRTSTVTPKLLRAFQIVALGFCMSLLLFTLIQAPGGARPVLLITLLIAVAILGAIAWWTGKQVKFAP